MIPKKIRVTLLLLVLAFVATNSWLTKLRATDWQSTLWLVIYPINGDNSERTAAYINGLQEDNFIDIESFMNEEIERYGLILEQPIEVKLAAEVTQLPPSPPRNGSTLDIILWSLKMRYWAYKVDNFEGPGDMQMFVIYHDPDTHERLDHSFGLEKGLLGVANAFAEKQMARKNHVVIAHEMLHLVGATDKYDLATNQPLYPNGFAEPEQQPLYPQQFAEIMGGRIPLTEHNAEIPRSLAYVLIGDQTAKEINWIE